MQQNELIVPKINDSDESKEAPESIVPEETLTVHMKPNMTLGDFLLLDDAIKTNDMVTMIRILEELVTVDEYPAGVRSVPVNKLEALINGLGKGTIPMKEDEIKN